MIDSVWNYVAAFVIGGCFAILVVLFSQWRKEVKEAREKWFRDIAYSRACDVWAERDKWLKQWIEENYVKKGQF